MGRGLLEAPSLLGEDGTSRQLCMDYIMIPLGINAARFVSLGVHVVGRQVPRVLYLGGIILKPLSETYSVHRLVYTRVHNSQFRRFLSAHRVRVPTAS